MPKQLVPAAAQAVIAKNPLSYFSALASLLILLHTHGNLSPFQCWSTTDSSPPRCCTLVSFGFLSL